MVIRSMALAVCGLALAAAPSKADPLDIKLGLWETIPAATDNAASAAMRMMSLPDDQLAKLTPEQRAALQQRMAAASAAQQKPHKFCVTEETRQKGIASDRTQSHCTRTVVGATAQMLEVHLACTGEMAATGVIRVTVADAATMNVTTDMTVSRGGQEHSMHIATQSHWVGDDCGDVKPIQ